MATQVGFLPGVCVGGEEFVEDPLFDEFTHVLPFSAFPGVRFRPEAVSLLEGHGFRKTAAALGLSGYIPGQGRQGSLRLAEGFF